MCHVLLCISVADAFLLICLHLAALTGHLTSLLPCFLRRSVLAALSCYLMVSSALPHLVFFSVLLLQVGLLCFFHPHLYFKILEQQIGALAGHLSGLCREEQKKDMSSVPSSFLLTQIIEAMLMGDTATQRRFNFVSKHLLESKKQTWKWMCARREAFWKPIYCKCGRFLVLFHVGFKERSSKCLFHYKKILCSLAKVRFVQ